MTTTRIPAPAVLDGTEAPRWIRRGSQQEVLAALRRLLSRPVVGGSRGPDRQAAAGNTAGSGGDCE